ncbi:MAG: PilZ domain-containing protein [Myxococcales bacterium]|jgi:hypothetical protein
MLVKPTQSPRRALRRAARIRCHAVGTEGFRLLGDRSLDLSPRGMLLACDEGVTPGEEVLISFLAPGDDELWLDAEAEVARVVQGYREGDPGYAAGLRFTYLERRARGELLARLAGTPPPVPRRRIRSARDRVATTALPVAPVVMQPTVKLWGAPPRGLFA